MIVIANYGMGNLGSISNMLKRIGAESRISASPDDIAAAAKLILPGVGAFDAGMRNIEERGLRRVLDEKALGQKVPILGICLGAQLMTTASEEGELPGLGWVPGQAKRFSVAEPQSLRVPHMGWNDVRVSADSPLTAGLPAESRFYFVHSYYIRVDQERDSILKTTYGVEFDSGIRRDNIFGVQFHPEKSHRFGMKILENFARL